MTAPRVLSAVTAAILLATLALGLLLPRRAVRQAQHEVLLAEAAVAQQLLAETADDARVSALLGDRWRETPAVPDELLDRPELAEAADGGPVARAARWADDRWTVTGTLEVTPLEPPAGLPLRLRLLAAVVAAGLLRLAFLWTGWSARDRAAATLLPALLAGALLAVPLVATGHWSSTRLEGLTDRRMDLGVAALGTLPDPAGVISRPGGVAQLTGLSFLVRRTDAGASFSTLLPATTEALAVLPSPPPGRVVVGRAPWAVAAFDAGPAGEVLLARTPLEHTRSPWGLLLGIGLAGLLLATAPVTLAPLVGAPAGAAGRRAPERAATEPLAGAEVPPRGTTRRGRAPGTTAAARSPAGSPARPRELRRNLVAWAFLAPAGVHLAIFTLGPLAFALWLSLHEWSLVDPARPFVGLANYAGILRDGAFWNAMANTAVFTLHVPVAMAVALGFALLVHRRAGAGRAVKAVRAILFLPTITSLVAVAVVWQWMLNDQYGLLNWLLESVGLAAVPWLTSPRTALAALMLMSVWLVVGYQMVLFQAGLAAIPEELYDAARIDGAGPWRRFLHVTLPGLRHTLFFVLVTSVIGSFQVFGAVYVMTEGGPLGATDVAVYHIYQEAWEFLRFGNAAAMSWVLFALIFAVTWLHFRLLERRADGGDAA